ncbi:MAG: amidase [Candidatus Heimdallarchaeota archaeon]
MSNNNKLNTLENIVDGVKLKEYTIDEIQELMKTGKLTAKKLTEEYLKRINDVDKKGPTLNSIIEINPDALDVAEQLDEERKQGKVRGPLHGIPVVIKDNIGTADNMQTTAGSLALEGHIPSEDAFIVKKLREAGAIIIAKANLSEWANFRSTRSSSGWSSRGGQTRNPYVLDRSPCGSSSGSAVAVAANLCIVAIGTETNGSVICPAHVNSVVGIKPTVGLISRTGIIPISHNQDTAGPMARTVRDAAILLGAMAGDDSEDPPIVEPSGELPEEYTQFLDENGLKGARIGVARNFFGKNDLVDKVLNEAIDKMKGAGATIIDPTNFEIAKESRDAQFAVLLYDFKHDMNVYLAKHSKNSKIKTLKDLIEFNEKHKEKVMPYFSQEIMIMAEEKGPITDKEYLEALTNCRKFTREDGIDKVMKKHKLDVIVAPSGGAAWPVDLINGDHFTFGSSSPAAVSGYASITVPAGYVFGVPVGLTFISGPYHEPTLLKITYSFEQKTKIRQPPKYLPTWKI